VHPRLRQVASVRSAGSIAERVKVLTGSDKAMSGRAAHEIGIVDYPGAQAACILGLTDLFGVASAMALDQGRTGEIALRVTHWKPVDSFDADLSCVYDSAPDGIPQPRTLIIPPTMVDPDPEIPAGVVTWVRSRHAAGATLVSLCSGAFILAETGLVDGLSVAAPPICATALAKRFPKVVVDTNRRIIDHGDIVTAGGFLSWVDLCLFLVERILGPAIRAETARFALDDPTAGEARYFAGFAPPLTHGDRAVLKAQEWVRMRDGQGVSLAALAAAAGLERRTLVRRFARATGMTPIEYCRTVRIARAREVLEGGQTSQKEIAESLGYRDVASFTRAFRKAVGLAPGAYRKRFGGKGISPADFAVQDGSRRKQHLFESGVYPG
jgi:transcriptional regulator GlxA family with amidase domain